MIELLLSKSRMEQVPYIGQGEYVRQKPWNQSHANRLKRMTFRLTIAAHTFNGNLSPCNRRNIRGPKLGMKYQQPKLKMKLGGEKKEREKVFESWPGYLDELGSHVGMPVILTRFTGIFS